MPRTNRGSEIHQELEHCARDKLRTEGYTVDIEVQLGKGRLIDVYGVKGNERAGVECMVRPSLSVINKAKLKYRDLNRFVVAIPHYAFSQPTDVEVWRLPVRRGMPNVESILTHVFHLQTAQLNIITQISGTNRIPLEDLVNTAIMEYLSTYTGEVSITSLKRTVDDLKKDIEYLREIITNLNRRSLEEKLSGLQH